MAGPSSRLFLSKFGPAKYNRLPICPEKGPPEKVDDSVNYEWLLCMASDLRQYSCSCKMQHDYHIYVVFGIDHVELGMSPRFNTRSNFNKFKVLM